MASKIDAPGGARVNQGGKISGQSGAPLTRPEGTQRIERSAAIPRGEVWVAKLAGGETRLGTWTSGRAKATFEAIIASEAGKPPEKTKGLEIRMEEGTRHARVYLDYDRDTELDSDSLTQFQRNVGVRDDRKG